MGTTFLNINSAEVINETSTVGFPISDRNNGAINASSRLLINVNAVADAMFPPNMPTTTGADVAVGAKIHIMAACARVSFIPLNAK